MQLSGAKRPLQLLIGPRLCSAPSDAATPRTGFGPDPGYFDAAQDR